MRTNWGARAHKDVPELLPDYEPSVGAIVKALHSLWGKENSDPAKVVRSSFVWPTTIGSRHISSSAATPFDTRLKQRRLAQPMQTGGGK
jgi:hypothetical protein